MSRLSRTVLLLVAGSVSFPVVHASAQPTSPGLSCGLSLGAGTAAPGSSFDKLGVAFGLRIGVNGRGIAIGVGFDALAWQLGGKDWDLGVVGPYLEWWPGAKPVFVRGVIGFGDRTRTVVGSSIDHDPGLGAVLTAGCDFHLRRGLVIVPEVTYGVVAVDGSPPADFMNLCLAFSFYGSSSSSD